MQLPCALEQHGKSVDCDHESNPEHWRNPHASNEKQNRHAYDCRHQRKHSNEDVVITAARTARETQYLEFRHIEYKRRSAATTKVRFIVDLCSTRATR